MSKKKASKRPQVEFEPKSNRDARWRAFHRLEDGIQQALKELELAVAQKNVRKLVEIRNQLTILLGECNFMAHEYTQIATSQRKRSA